MASKEIKSALKAAKVAIQNKDFKEALHHCEFILKRDGSNYNALVFAGLCYSETKLYEQARVSYSDAIKCQPDQILAYQGFEKLYTRHWTKQKTEAEMRQLAEIYERLLTLLGSKDVKRSLEISSNLCKTYIEVGDLRKALEMIQNQWSKKEELDAETRILFAKMVFDAYEGKGADEALKTEFFDLVTSAFQALCEETSSADDAVSVLVKYTHLIKASSDLFCQNLRLVLDSCQSLHSKYPEQHLPVEVLIQAYVQNYEHESLKDISDKIEELDSTGATFAKIGIGYLEFRAGNQQKAVDALSGAVQQHAAFLPGWVVFCKSLVQLRKYGDAEKASRAALAQYKQILSGNMKSWLLPISSMDDIRFDLTKCLAVSLSSSHVTQNVQTGVTTLEKLYLLRDDPSLYTHMGQGLVKLEQYPKALDAFSKALHIKADEPDALAWKEYTNFKIGNKEESIAALQNLPPSASSLYLLGKAMWELGGEYRTGKKHCFTTLVKAAKLDPNNHEIFLLLGHFYTQVQKDYARAKGCYLKSYQLDPASEEAAACLADVYVAEGDTDSAIALYESITKEAGPNSCKWAHLRLGLCRLQAKDVNNAIQCFQCALRINSDDVVCWECLGEGYLQRGSFTAAWKAFGRAYELDPTSVYSLYQMAKVKQVQGLFADAVKEYAGVLELSPDYVPGLQGLCESELLLARQMMNEGRYRSGLEHVEKAISHLASACLLRRDLCCLWKLLGDCCIMVHPLDVSIVQMKIPAILLGSQDDGDKFKLTEVGKDLVLQLSSRFYCRAINLQAENASLWHDLGLSYMKQTKDDGDSEESVELASKAVNCLKKAITLEPSNHVFWNSLGVIVASKCVNNPALSQHCFLTSIKHEQNNVRAWSNLATLYLSHEHVKQAHEAFKVAQSLDPSFVNSWVGQAIIAETVGSNETVDLYRHSTELGIQKQGGIGYSGWVARVVADLDNRESQIFKDNIRDMNAVSAAVTQMSKQCDKDRSCAWSSNMYGFLLEYSGLSRSAMEAYKQACSILTESLGKTQQSDAKDELQKNFNKAASNLARLQCKTGAHSDAIATFQRISPLADFHDVCGLALAFFKSGQYLKALEAYKQAGQLTLSESEKGQVMVAMAMTMWKMGKPDEAKTLLYKCFQSSKSGLQALCALGILAGDRTLVGAAVGEIMKQKDRDRSEEGVFDDAMLIAAAAVLCGDEKMAVNGAQHALHQCPSSWAIQSFLSTLLISLNHARGCRSVSLIASKAERLFRDHSSANPLHRDSELWKSCKLDSDHLSICRCLAASTLSAGTNKSSNSLLEDAKLRLRQAQKFAHMHPHHPAAWAYVSCAYHVKNFAEWLNGRSPSNTEMVETLSTTALRLLEGAASNKSKLEEWREKLLASSRSLIEEGAGSTATLKDIAAKISEHGPQGLLLKGLELRTEKNHRKSKQMLNRVMNSVETISDSTRSVAIWYLYRTLHERNDTAELEKLVARALDMGDANIARIVELLPIE